MSKRKSRVETSPEYKDEVSEDDRNEFSMIV